MAAREGKVTNEPGIETYLGKRFYLLRPSPEMIHIEDIAHALSQCCRFTGHTKNFYSVAEHSIHVSNLVPPEDALAGLLHDASEAYASDMSRPLKDATDIGVLYKQVENRIQRVVAEKFNLKWPWPPSIKTADNAMLLREKEELLSPAPWDWATSEPLSTDRITIACYSPQQAEYLFIKRFRELYVP